MVSQSPNRTLGNSFGSLTFRSVASPPKPVRFALFFSTNSFAIHLLYRPHLNHETIVHNEAPPVGTYSPHIEYTVPLSPKLSFSKAKRFSDKTEGTPSPSQYNPDLQHFTQSITFTRDKRFHETVNNVPGFVYEPKFSTSNTGSPVTFGRSKRELSPRKYMSEAPPATKYSADVGFEKVAPRSPSVKIGTSKRGNLASNSISPPPGAYNINRIDTLSNISNTPAFTFTKSTPRKPHSETPAPNYYSPKTGTELEAAKSKGISFPKEKKFRQTSHNETPGYVYQPVDRFVANSSPAYSFPRSKTPGPKPTISETPTPVKYNPKTETVQPKSPAYSFPKSKAAHAPLASTSEAPGYVYDVESSYRAISAGGPRLSFSRTKRDLNPSTSTAPPPTQYFPENTKSVLERAPVTVFPKDKRRTISSEAKSQAPGFVYNPSSPTLSISKGITFAKDKRNKRRDDSVPGVGTYQISDDLVKPAAPRAVMYLTG